MIPPGSCYPDSSTSSEFMILWGWTAAYGYHDLVLGTLSELRQDLLHEQATYLLACAVSGLNFERTLRFVEVNGLEPERRVATIKALIGQGADVNAKPGHLYNFSTWQSLLAHAVLGHCIIHNVRSHPRSEGCDNPDSDSDESIFSRGSAASEKGHPFGDFLPDIVNKLVASFIDAGGSMTERFETFPWIINNARAGVSIGCEFPVSALLETFALGLGSDLYKPEEEMFNISSIFFQTLAIKRHKLLPFPSHITARHWFHYVFVGHEFLRKRIAPLATLFECEEFGYMLSELERYFDFLYLVLEANEDTDGEHKKRLVEALELMQIRRVEFERISWRESEEAPDYASKLIFTYSDVLTLEELWSTAGYTYESESTQATTPREDMLSPSSHDVYAPFWNYLHDKASPLRALWCNHRPFCGPVQDVQSLKDFVDEGSDEESVDDKESYNESVGRHRTDDESVGDEGDD